LQSGDLVFFTSPRSGRGVGHVGIVVDVDPINNTFTFIHASTNNGITINSSTDSGYARRYIGARRVQQ
jgi:cell wall-associated NlpC family hydrolase